jgi:ABC-type polysaccharide/polyol phosphate transport system ATPase subunit
MSSETVIQVNNLSKCYEIYEKPQDRLLQMLSRGRRQYYKEFWALRDVSFEVKQGETFGIIGRNGSGKSTLLQILAGTLAQTSGEALVKGRVAALLELGSGFNPEFTGRENVYLNGSVLGLTQREIEDRYDQIVEFADIGEFIDQPVKTYSSGMFVRLAFAVQAHIDASIVIIDEAQNLTPKQMKTLITRAGPGTKIICMGNLAQIDTPYLTEGSSGLTFAVDKFKGWPHGGHITLARGERSRLADFASEVL